MYRWRIYAEDGIHCKASITCTAERTEGLVWTGLEAGGWYAMYGRRLYAEDGLHCIASITYTDERTGGFVWTGLEADFVIVVDGNAGWKVVFDTTFTYTPCWIF